MFSVCELESLSRILSGLELGRDVLISGARVIQLIGAILLPRAVSLVIGLVGDMAGGKWQTASACVAAQFDDSGPWSRGLSRIDG